MKKKIYNLIISSIYHIFDFLAINLAILFSYGLYRFLGIGKQVRYALADIIPLSMLAAFATMLVLQIFRAYKKESSVLNVEEIKNVVKGITLTFLLIALVTVFMKLAPSRYVLVFSYIMSLLFIVIERTVLYHNVRLITSIEGVHKRVLIYGAGELGQILYHELVNSPKLGIIPVGFIDDDFDKQGVECYPSGYNCSNGISVLGTRKDIIKLKEELGIDEVYVAISNIDHSALINILYYLKSENIRASFVPNLYSAFMHKVKLINIGSIPLVIREDHDFKSPYLYIKRYIDLLFGLILLPLLCPFFFVIAMAIKIDSKGSVFFKHKRIGKDSNPFEIYKFRTMIEDTNPYAVNPLDQNDARITRVGKYLRKTSMDELPQIINILKGDMSFVGPRPEMPYIVKGYDETQKERLRVLPGITGLWQLSGDRKKAIHENMDYDLYYIKNVSFFLDLTILIETLIFAFKGI